MISKYGIICEVADCGSFTAAADRLGYSQSSISQSIRSLEEELGVRLLDRKRHGISWTDDGLEFEPFIRAIYNSETALMKKRQSLAGLDDAIIRIGTFTSVSRDILPSLMTDFKKQYPNVRFELHQGDYNNIGEWLKNNVVDLGFLSSEMTGDLPNTILYQDEMLAVLPMDHPLSSAEHVSLKELSEDSFILLDEGEYSTTLDAFRKESLTPKVEYTVYDDYSILSMVKNHLGVSILFKNVVAGYEDVVAVKKLSDPIIRKVCLACYNPSVLSYASKQFMNFTVNAFKGSYKVF